MGGRQDRLVSATTDAPSILIVGIHRGNFMIVDNSKTIADAVVTVVGTLTAGACWFRFMRLMEARYIKLGPLFQPKDSK